MKRIKEIVETRVRYDYRRIHVLLRREGWRVNAKRVCRRIVRWACNCATNPRSAESRRSCGPTAAPRGRRTRSEDGLRRRLHDQLVDGRKIRILTMVDLFTRLSPAPSR